MNKSFMTFLGTAIICATIGIVTSASGKVILSTIFYTFTGISATITILLGVNPKFFETLNRYAVAWLFSALGFGILAFYLKTLGAEYGTMILVFATFSSLSIVSVIGHGFYPNRERAGSLLTIAFNLAFYIPITWLVLGGSSAPLEMFKAPVANQIVNVIPQEIGVIDALIKILISIFRLQPVQINGVLPFPHFILLIHLGWNFFKFMRSYGWWFICSTIAIPFLIVAWVNHIPKALGFPLYFMATLSVIVLSVFGISLWKHWRIPTTT